MPVYKVGIIGCGNIASGFEDDPLREHPCTHAGAYSKFKKTKIVAASDIDKKQLDKFSKKWNVNKVYLDYKEMLKNEDLDIISVTSITSTHSKITIDASKSGVKVIFCEKPITTSLEEVDKMIKACRENNVKIIINHTRRWDIRYHIIKQMINKNKIGKIVGINGYCRGGLLIMGTHLFDMMRYFSGDVKEVFATTEKITKGDFTKTDPSGSGYLVFKNGAHGFVNTRITNDMYHFFEIDILGSKGRLRISDDGRLCEYWAAKKSKYNVIFNELEKTNIPLIEYKNLMLSAVEDVVNAIERNKEGICTGDDGRAALELVLAFHESQRTGRKIRLPLKNRKLRIISR